MTQQFKLKHTLGFNLLICKEYVILQGRGVEGGIPWAQAQNTLENTVLGYTLKNTVPISPETLLKIQISSRSET